jgi:flagellar biosynthetic protein FlhB
VLAYVYKLRAAMRGDGPNPGELNHPFVPPDLDPLTKTARAAHA